MKSTIFTIASIVLCLFLAGCGADSLLIRMVPGSTPLKESVIFKDSGWGVKDKIAIVDLDGAIMNAPPEGLMKSGENPLSLFRKKLQRVAGDQQIKAVIIRINSPGGSVTASDLMYHELKEFKKQKNVPVVAYMMDVAASGGYYVACACDEIYASPTTVTGSIGTIMQTVSVEGTMKFIGVKSVTIKSGPLKDLGSPFHDMKDDEKAILEGIINSLYDKFLTVVEKERSIPRDQLVTIADGRVYTADQALQLKLIDNIGYPQDVMERIRTLAKIKKAKVVMYHPPYQQISSFYDTIDTRGDSVPAINVEFPGWIKAQGPQFLYMWRPDLN